MQITFAAGSRYSLDLRVKTPRMNLGANPEGRVEAYFTDVGLKRVGATDTGAGSSFTLDDGHTVILQPGEWEAFVFVENWSDKPMTLNIDESWFDVLLVTPQGPAVGDDRSRDSFLPFMIPVLRVGDWAYFWPITRSMVSGSALIGAGAWLLSKLRDQVRPSRAK